MGKSRPRSRSILANQILELILFVSSPLETWPYNGISNNLTNVVKPIIYLPPLGGTVAN